MSGWCLSKHSSVRSYDMQLRTLPFGHCLFGRLLLTILSGDCYYYSYEYHYEAININSIAVNIINCYLVFKL